MSPRKRYCYTARTTFPTARGLKADGYRKSKGSRHGAYSLAQYTRHETTERVDDLSHITILRKGRKPLVCIACEGTPIKDIIVHPKAGGSLVYGEDIQAVAHPGQPSRYDERLDTYMHTVDIHGPVPGPEGIKFDFTEKDSAGQSYVNMGEMPYRRLRYLWREKG